MSKSSILYLKTKQERKSIMRKNVKFKEDIRSYPKNSAIVDIDVDDGVQEVTFGGDTSLDVDLYDVKKQFPDVKKLIIKNNIASISISNFMFPNVEDVVSYNRNYQTGGIWTLKK